MPRSSNPLRYPKEFFELTIAASAEPVFIPCPDRGKALNLRHSLYGFWNACDAHPPEGMGTEWQGLMMTIEQREEVWGVLVYPKTQDWKAKLVAGALVDKEVASVIPLPGFLSEYFTEGD